MKTTMKTAVHIRWMIRRDMPEVLGIEAANFPYPWSEADFNDCLRNRNVIGHVAEHRDRIVGFMIYELYRQRIELINFAVHAAMQRQGVGTAMVHKLHGKLFPQRREQIAVNVWERNDDACLFFRAMGFKAVGIVPTPWEDERCNDDAYRFVLRQGGFTR